MDANLRCCSGSARNRGCARPRSVDLKEDFAVKHALSDDFTCVLLERFERSSNVVLEGEHRRFIKGRQSHAKCQCGRPVTAVWQRDCCADRQLRVASAGSLS